MTDDRDQRLILWFDEIGIDDVPLVGGKNASLGASRAPSERPSRDWTPTTWVTSGSGEKKYAL